MAQVELHLGRTERLVSVTTLRLESIAGQSSEVYQHPSRAGCLIVEGGIVDHSKQPRRAGR